MTAILGLADYGAPFLVRIPPPDVAHILVSRTTGSVKTALLQTLTLSKVMTNPPVNSHELYERRNVGGMALVLLDPKAVPAAVSRGCPTWRAPLSGVRTRRWRNC